MSYLGIRTGHKPHQVKKLAVWGNTSNTIFIDTRRASVNHIPIDNLVEKSWINDEMAPRVRQRFLEVIRLRKLSSAASTANAALLHMRDWLNGSVDWQAVGLRANGKLYGVPEGIFCSVPCTTVEGEINPVTSLKFEDEISANSFKVTLDELILEREIVSDLLG